HGTLDRAGDTDELVPPPPFLSATTLHAASRRAHLGLPPSLTAHGRSSATRTTYREGCHCHGAKDATAEVFSQILLGTKPRRLPSPTQPGRASPEASAA